MKFTTPRPIRSRITQLAVSVVCGTAVAVAGWYLIDQAAREWVRRIESEESAKIRLGQTLLHSTLRIGSVGMRELTALPLISEYLEIAETSPNSIDVEELRLYLQEILSVTYGELGADVLLAVGRNGKVHLKLPKNFSDPVPDKFTGTGAFLVDTTDGRPQLWMRQPVPGYDKPDNPAGTLYMKFPDASIAEIERAGLGLRTVSGMQDVATPGGSDFAIRIAMEASPETDGLRPLRIFALVAGFAVFIGFAWRLRAGRKSDG